MRVERNVRIPMRDGIELATDFYAPDAAGRFPMLLERTPYNREQSVIFRTKTPEFFASRGYVVVVQDVRGRFGSDGIWYPFRADGWGSLRDGFDSIEWLARHPLSNGRIGTIGGSFAGMTQMLLAPTRPPHLVACYVRESASDLSRQWVYRDGAFELAFNLEWNLRHAVPVLAKQAGVIKAALDRKPEVYQETPWLSHGAIADPHAWLRDCLSHPTRDDFYTPFDIESHWDRIAVPMLHLGGWFDIFLGGTLRNYLGLRARASTAKARRAQRLVIGPWMHGPPLLHASFDRFVGEMDFGPDAMFDLNSDMLGWFDQWMRDKPPADSPPVRYFLMGANRWCSSEDWPPSEAEPVRYFLHRGSERNSRSLNNGRLSPERPRSVQSADSYTYDPRKPVSSVGGNTLHSFRLPPEKVGPLVSDFMAAAGPRDQRAVENLCLTYTSELLEQDLGVVGPVRVVLYASSSAPDTDFVARLTDVFPDGRSMLVSDGILRARYRRDRARPRPLRPGKTYRFVIDLWSTAWVFPAGHRLRVAVTSSCFPRFDLNPNTLGTFASSSGFQTANNRVFHDSRRPSHLEVYVLRNLC